MAANGSGPNGALFTPNRRLWVGDGNSTLRVADVDPDSPNYLNVLKSINTSVTDPISPSFCDNGGTNPGIWHLSGPAASPSRGPPAHLSPVSNKAPLSPPHADPRPLAPPPPHTSAAA